MDTVDLYDVATSPASPSAHSGAGRCTGPNVANEDAASCTTGTPSRKRSSGGQRDMRVYRPRTPDEILDELDSVMAIAGRDAPGAAEYIDDLLEELLKARPELREKI
jgi:hypothetical protein